MSDAPSTPRKPGRPPGSKNKRTVWIENMALKDAAEVVAEVIKQAKAGNMKAAELFLARVWPAPKGRQIPLVLPPADSAAGVTAGYGATVKALSRGAIDPTEAVQVGQLLEGQRRAIETTDLAARVKKLEAKS